MLQFDLTNTTNRSKKMVEGGGIRVAGREFIGPKYNVAN